MIEIFNAVPNVLVNRKRIILTLINMCDIDNALSLESVRELITRTILPLCYGIRSCRLCSCLE